MATQTRTLSKEAGSVVLSRTLATSQVVAVVVLGVIFWFVAAMAVRFGAPAGLFGPIASVFAFAIGFPIAWLTTLFIKQVAGLQAGQTLPGIAIALMAATFCDGIALTWTRDLYGSDPAMVTFGAAWILWGVGLFLLFAYLDDLRHARQPR